MPSVPSGRPAAPPLRTEILRSVGALAHHEGAWLDLLGRSACNQATLSPLWLLTWWKVFGGTGTRQLRVCLFWNGPTLVGLAPLLRRWRLAPTGLPFVRLELLGTGEPEQHEIASDYVGIVAAQGHEDSVALALADLLADSSRADDAHAQGLGHWDELRLCGLDALVPTLQSLRSALEHRGLGARLETDAGAPYIPLPVSWGAYLSALTSTDRYFVRRTLRDFESWAGSRVRFHRAQTPAELGRGRQILMSLHAERWQARNREGVFASPLFRAFHEAVMPALLARGALDLRWMTVDDRPIAAVYNIVWANRVQFYQGGRAVDVPKSVRPGIVLHLHAIRAAIEAGHVEYDFLAGGSRYKQQLALALRPMGMLVIEKPGLRRFVDQITTRTWRRWRIMRRFQ
jgi:CelD/BcsL family acetyltransferase involved in cellulose biosynthesis